jgi:hypothetical protein
MELSYLGTRSTGGMDSRLQEGFRRGEDRIVSEPCLELNLSRVPWNDLQFSQPALNAELSATLPFVIPSEAEGPAVLYQHRMPRQAPPSPLSSRAKPRDLRFSKSAPNAEATAPAAPESAASYIFFGNRKETSTDRI